MLQMEKLARRWGWGILLTALCIPAVLPLTTGVFFRSYDGILHFFRVFLLNDAIQQGILYPRLFPFPGYAYGQAILNFYGPLSYYFAALLRGLGADNLTAYNLVFALGYILAGWTAYLLARRFVPPLPALVGAVVYVYFPYHIHETYVRGALAEHMAWIFLPSILWALTPHTAQSAELTKRALVFAVSMAGLVLTHNLTALMFMPVVLCYAGLMTAHIPVRRRIAFLALALCGALTLSIFYWLPALAQSQWVRVSYNNLVGDFTPDLASLQIFLQTSPAFIYPLEREDGYPAPLGLLSLVLLCVSLVALGRYAYRRDPLTRPLLAFVGMSLGSIFMMLEISGPLWQALRNPLAFAQFPWRVMTFTGLGTAIATAIIVRRHPRIAVALLPLLILTATPGVPLRPLPKPASDAIGMWQYDFDTGFFGTTGDREFVPLWVHAENLEIPRASRAPVSDSNSLPARLSLTDAGYTYRRYRVQSDAPATLRFHQFYLPQWRATLNGRPLQTFPSSFLGLLTVDVPPTSDGILEVDFGATPLEVWTLAVSWLTLAIIVVLARHRWIYVAAAGCLIAGAAFAVTRTANPSPVHSVTAQFETTADLAGAQFDRAPLRAGDTLRITLFWLARKETRENLRVFLHVIEADTGKIIAQSDSTPGGGFTPTSQWRTGEVVEDFRIIKLPSDARPGTLQIFAGLYRNPPVRNLPAQQNGQEVPGGRVAIGTVEVVSR